MNTEECVICGDKLNKQCIYKLECNHVFHYECILNSYKSSKKRECPYCRNVSNNLLPVVNGINKLSKGIHYNNNVNEVKHENIKCQFILKTGKNKGNLCNSKCKLGYNYCGRHYNKV